MTAKHQLHKHEDLLPAPELSAGSKQEKEALCPWLRVIQILLAGYTLWVRSIIEVR